MKRRIARGQSLNESWTLDLPQRNMAFRGSSDKLFTDNNGNFLKQIEFLAKYDELLKEHLRRIRSGYTKDHYCGKDIQNELIDILASQTLKNILSRLKASKYYAVILDCTPDISHSEKMTFVVRFVNISANPLKVEEYFLGFKTVPDSTGEGLKDLLLQYMLEFGIDLKDCRGQGYDNGTNVVGKERGVQARMLALNPRAFSLPCGCHSLNLVVSDAASSQRTSITLFGVLQRIYVLFSASPRRWLIFRKRVRKLTAKPLSTTR